MFTDQVNNLHWRMTQNYYVELISRKRKKEEITMVKLIQKIIIRKIFKRIVEKSLDKATTRSSLPGVLCKKHEFLHQHFLHNKNFFHLNFFQNFLIRVFFIRRKRNFYIISNILRNPFFSNIFTFF